MPNLPDREWKLSYLQRFDPEATFAGTSKVATNYAQIHGRLWVVLVASEKNGRWWLALPADYGRQKAEGAVLLCRKGSVVHAFELSREFLDEVTPAMKPNNRGQVAINVHTRGAGKFAMAVPGDGLDESGRRARNDWRELTPGTPAFERADRVAEAVTPYEAANRSVAAPPSRPENVSRGAMYVRVEKGRLLPLDPIEWPDGTEMLLSVREVGPAPKLRVVRRIAALAADAPAMPSDLSTEHDHYAHGAPRRT
jgi:hypothetical protein